MQLRHLKKHIIKKNFAEQNRISTAHFFATLVTETRERREKKRGERGKSIQRAAKISANLVSLPSSSSSFLSPSTINTHSLSLLSPLSHGRAVVPQEEGDAREERGEGGGKRMFHRERERDCWPRRKHDSRGRRRRGEGGEVDLLMSCLSMDGWRSRKEVESLY